MVINIIVNLKYCCVAALRPLRWMLWRLLGPLPDSPPFQLQQGVGRDYKIGEGTYGWPVVAAHGDNGLSIGKYCSIAKNVMIFLKADHRVDWITTYPFTAFWPEAKDYSGHPKKKGGYCHWE